MEYAIPGHLPAQVGTFRRISLLLPRPPSS
jgi:hypothetical protein